MYKKLLLFTTYTLIYLGFQARSQDATVIKNQYLAYNSQVYTEKIFVHIDKPGYTAGETIWFKVYNVDDAANKPATVSKIVYAEILNEKNESVLQGKIGMEKGRGNGSFYLPFSLSSGNYRFRAYTSWMKNFSPNYFFEQPLFVVNPLKSPSTDSIINAVRKNYDAQFFPEGGNIVNGLQSKIGVKVVDRNGAGVDFKGSIVNQGGEVVANFSSFKFGMGNFSFTPVDGHSYKAIVRMNDGDSLVSALPSSYKEGIVMTLIETDRHLKITVRSTDSYLQQAIFLLAHSRQSLKKAEMQVFHEKEVNFYINKNELGEGINHLTIFDQNKKPLCERLYFVQPAEKLVIDATPTGTDYDTRSLASVDIFNHDVSGATQLADMSLGIYKWNSLYSNPTTISGYLWLSGDLPGYVESPEYYLTKDKDAAIAADNLMLTQGWRRFNWQDVMQNKTPAFYFLPEYEGHIIDGKVTNKKTSTPASNIPVFVSPIGGRNNFGTAITNQEGYFLSVTSSFYGPGNIVVQTSKDAGEYQFEVSNPFSTDMSDKRFPLLSISPKDRDAILEAGIETQAQNIYLKTQLQKFKQESADDTTFFYGKPDAKYFLDSYTRFNTMEEVMREYVSGVSVRKQNGKFHFRVNNQPREQYFSADPLVLLDGVPVFEVDKIANYDPLKIKKIEVMNRQYLLNNQAWPGIVSYSSYDQKMGGFKMDPSVLVMNYEGLQLQREFYSPVYETPEQKASRLPDFRNQLLWKSDINTDVNGKARVSFYTSDIEGRFIGVVNGVTSSGKVASKAFFFDVKKK